MKATDFQYDLPPELIADQPATQRTDSRLLVVNRQTGSIEHHLFRDFPAFVRSEDLLVLNDTRVRRAILHDAEERVEVVLLEPTAERHIWVTLTKPGKKTRPGRILEFEPRFGTAQQNEAEALEKRLSGEVLDVLPEGERIIRFSRDFDLELYGEIPLPPYIRQRRKECQAVFTDDAMRYQTVYAREEGSVAAPTAGLHFTTEMLATLPHTFLTLHIGAGTFRPVKVEDLSEHPMHAEHFSIPEGLANRLASARRVIAVGTTVARVLESVDDLGPQRGSTNLFIYPPYAFKRVDALLTNFHLPQSTLLMLVCAFAGTDLILCAYEEAVRERYRFYSYGDAMLVL